MSTAVEKRVRRAAEHHGLLLRKLRENDRWFHVYGPFMLVDASTYHIVVKGLTLDQADEAVRDWNEPEAAATA